MATRSVSRASSGIELSASVGHLASSASGSSGRGDGVASGSRKAGVSVDASGDMEDIDNDGDDIEEDGMEEGEE